MQYFYDLLCANIQNSRTVEFNKSKLVIRPNSKLHCVANLKGFQNVLRLGKSTVILIKPWD